MARPLLPCLDLARTQYHALSGLITPRPSQGLRPMGIAPLLWGVMTVPGGCFSVGTTRCTGSWPTRPRAGFLYRRRRAGLCACRADRSADCYLALRRTLLEAGVDRVSTLETAKVDCQRLHEAYESRQRAEIGRANERLFAATARPRPPRARHGPRSRPSTRRGWRQSPPRGTRFSAGADAQVPAADPGTGCPRYGRLGSASRAIPPDPGSQQGPARARVERDGPTLDERRGAVRRRGGNDPRELPAVVSRLERG